MIVVGNATTTRALQRATKTIPIVMASINNAVGNGFVASLAKPGGNITGIAILQDEVLGKLIGILHEVVPGARRVAIVLNESNPNHAVFWAAARSACAALDLVALRVVANAPAQFGAASEQIVRQRSQAVVVVADPIYLNERVELQRLLQPTRLPVAYAWREQVAAGGLLSYGPDLAANYRLGSLLMEEKQYDEAITYFRKTLELSPFFSKVYQLLAQCQIALDQPAVVRSDQPHVPHPRRLAHGLPPAPGSDALDQAGRLVV